MSFAATLASFCSELAATFPELESVIQRAAARVTPEFFWSGWQGNLAILRARDFVALQTERRGLLLGPVALTPALWGEISETTRQAIWRYLRTLMLEAVLELNLSDSDIDMEKMGMLMEIMLEEQAGTGSGPAEETVAETLMDEAREHLNPLLERLRTMMGAAAAGAGAGLHEDASGVSMPPLPEIPERLKNGRIARLAQQLAAQFNPTEFGIDPAMLEGDDPMAVLQRLAELYQRDPTLLVAGAQRVAERIKRQILGGSLDRDGLIAEAREFVALFRDHPLFKEPIAKFEALLGEGGLAGMFAGAGAGAGGGSGSERLRRVQERLRKKTAAKAAAAAEKRGTN